MRAFVLILAALPFLPALAFSSAAWLAARNDDADMLRLRKASAACARAMTAPAQDVVFPIEAYPDGTVKSRLKAGRAQFFLDTGFIYGEGVCVEQYARDGKTVENSLEAERCVVDRNTKSGWVEGRAVLHFGKSVVKGRGVYFSVDREQIRIYSESEIRTPAIKLKPGSFK